MVVFRTTRWSSSAVGGRVLRLGRNLLAVPLDLDRHLRDEVRHHQLRLLVHGAGVGLVLGGPLAAHCTMATGSWLPVIGIIIAMDVLTGLPGADRAEAGASTLPRRPPA